MSIPEAPKDKRTKAYKQWKAKYDSAPKGLGDTIEKITTATGIKKAVKFLAGEDCGCDERKKILNQKFKYKKPDCFNESEFLFIKSIVESGKQRLDACEVKMVVNTFNRVFKENRRATNCSSLFINNVFNPLKRLYETYK